MPYDVPSRVAVLQARQAARTGRQGKAVEPQVAEPEKARHEGLAVAAQELARESDVAVAHGLPHKHAKTAAGVAAIGAVTGGKVTVEGKVRVMEIRPVERNSVLAVEISDSTGSLTAMFYGRSHIPGVICGARVRFTGSAGIRGGQPVMINPAY